jgi:hypothetical protein
MVWLFCQKTSFVNRSEYKTPSCELQDLRRGKWNSASRVGESLEGNDTAARMIHATVYRELKVAEGRTLWPILREELLNFRRKINLKTAHDSYEHWRETDHDDLVLATALACWRATRRRDVSRVVRW